MLHHEIIENLANKMRLRQSHVMRFLEGKPSVWDKMTTNETSLSIYTADEILRLAEQGEASVIRGWGASHLLGEVKHVVRVRVCATEGVRTERMMQRLNTTDKDAVEKEIRLSDEAHSAIMRRHFDVNWKDAEHYDLVLNTGRLSVDECISAIMNAIKLPAFQETSASAQALRDLALQAHVRAALRLDERTKKLNIVVTAANGHITLGGITEKNDDIKYCADVSAAVSGVSGVTNQLKSTSRDFRRFDSQGAADPVCSAHSY